VLLPVVGTPVLSVPFGRRRDPFTGGMKWHYGVDLVAARGTPVVAAARGTVYDIDDDKRWDKVVRIRHRHGFTTVYAHLGSTKIKRRARVKRGQQIGTIGSTGFSTGPHLHYEVRRNGTPIDPQIVFYPALDSLLSRAGDLGLE
jgi:murein DD-endopeptidase MepM/ murein hydrolase activator NlpD